MKYFELICYYLFKYPYYKWRFRRFGFKARLLSAQIDGFEYIEIGDRVYVNRGGWLACKSFSGESTPALSIGDGTYIGRYCHIYATSKIEIGRKVLIADKVYIADNLHDYQRIDVPIIDQPVKQLKPVVIGDGSWLGENVCIIGASIGRNAVIAANAVVTHDVPDHCIAAGIPAVIIKRFDPASGEWRKTNPAGQFI